MTSKVVELRGLIIYDLTKYYDTAAVNLGKRAEPEAIEMTDGLISAAHAEGVAEGKEQRRLEIRKAAQITEYDADGYAILFAVSASVLAPTKESEK